MGDNDSLRLPCRAGGVDDVGGVVGTQRLGALGVRGVPLRALSQCADRVRVIKQELSDTLRQPQPLGDPGAGQDTGRLGVPEHVASRSTGYPDPGADTPPRL